MNEIVYLILLVFVSLCVIFSLVILFNYRSISEEVWKKWEDEQDAEADKRADFEERWKKSQDHKNG